LTDEQITRFREDGFIRLPKVLSAAVLAHYEPEITRYTLENNAQADVPLAERSTYGKAFIQVMNVWVNNATVREVTFSKRLAGIAAGLLGTRGVRIYHDQALYKEAGGGFTPWHADQQYWPMSSSLSVTAWIPLQAVPEAMGPLCFGRGSHVKRIGRDLEISDESEQRICEELRREKVVEVYEPFALGDVSFHYGWTLHRAGPNTTETPRKVYTIIYMDEAMKLAEPRNDNQRRDWQTWSPSSRVGETMADELNPVIPV
jgi:ectoine hydroxylase-related dioxygenase (phytanoyl-CoA dioxygenase family)